MENKSITTTKIIPSTTNNDKNNPIDDEKKKKKKKRRPFNLLKAALLIMRGRSRPKSNAIQVEVASKGMFKNLVGSMRPLHLQNHPSSPKSVQSEPPPYSPNHFEDVLPPPTSPHCATTSSTDGMSRYASANNLQELDKGEGSRCASSSNLQELDDCDGSTDDEVGDSAGDEMIDAKAEEFIAQFYNQMRLERSN